MHGVKTCTGTSMIAAVAAAEPTAECFTFTQWPNVLLSALGKTVKPQISWVSNKPHIHQS